MSISRGKYIVLGEVNVVCSALRRDLQKANRWDSHDQQVDEDHQIQLFHELKSKLNKVTNLTECSPIEFLLPFLEVIQCEDLEGPITGLALSTVNKFLSYGLIDVDHHEAGVIVERLAQSVTHARFRGTNPANDEVVLMKIIMVLRTLILTPIGQLLTNETVREIMISCFRICFTKDFSELLRKTSEHTLVDAVQLLFSRLDYYREIKREEIRSRKGVWMNELFKGKKKKGRKKLLSQQKPPEDPVPEESIQQEEPVMVPNPNEKSQNLEDDVLENAPSEDVPPAVVEGSPEENETEALIEKPEGEEETKEESENLPVENPREYNLAESFAVEEQKKDPQLLHSNSIMTDIDDDEDDLQQPYGLSSIIELLDFISSLINIHDPQNSDHIIKTGLSLITVALEVARDHILEIPELLDIVRVDLTKYLYQLLSCDKQSLVAASTRVSILLFETMRHSLKYQQEEYLKKIIEIIRDENQNSYELKELLLEYLVQLFHLPGMATELYLNYDCDNHCSNLYEELTKLLSKQAFPANAAQLYSTHLHSLDGLYTLVDSIEQNCQKELNETSEVTPNPAPKVYNLDSGVLVAQRIQNTPSNQITNKKNGDQPFPPRFSSAEPEIDEIINIKQRKKLFNAGSELFNQKPKKGIQFLQEQGLFEEGDWPGIAQWLRTNPLLSKKQIGEYIADRKNPDLLQAYVNTFDFSNNRIDEGLRMYLNAFRLPGEAPVIQRILEAFSPAWHEANGCCFKDNDSVVVLAYAVIMLNTDQHNDNVAKNATPMTEKTFKSNLRGCNGGENFDQDMLGAIFDKIHNDEIVLKEEQTGTMRDEWIWDEIQTRSKSPQGIYLS